MRNINSFHLGIYARFSSDLQNPMSVKDQEQACRNFITERFSIGQSQNARLYNDNAISGETMKRPGLQRLLEAIETGYIDIVIAESLSRISRKLKDIATIHEICSYHGVKIFTLLEGEITVMHVALKGTMNALANADMKKMVQRGQKGRVEAGYSASSISYGYRKVYGVIIDGREQNGVREIAPEEASIIKRIYQEYSKGKKPSDIIEGLNADKIPSPSGRDWKKSTLLGSNIRKDGILRNESYLGKLIFNKSYVVRDPVTNKKRFVYHPEEKWTKVDVPHLQIISQKLWNKVRERDVPRTIIKKTKKRRILNTHNQHALTGWIFCGECHSAKSIANATRYVCSGYRYARICTNARGTKEETILQAVTGHVLDRIKNGPDFRDDFALAFLEAAEQKRQQKAEATILKEKIKRLVLLVAEGIKDDHTAEIIKNLQDELDHLNHQIKNSLDIPLPSEEQIRTTLLETVGRILVGRDIEAQRIMFTHILNDIKLLPIKEKRSGETISIHLRERGWPELWKQIHTP